MRTEIIYDVGAIGIGPFNLGLAALCHPIKGLKTIFFEQKQKFCWHEGMLIPGTTLQVPYLADLVTLADPSNPFTYLNFLRHHNRLLQFGIRDAQYITRLEYNRYCQWVCNQLENLQFGYTVTDIAYIKDKNCFKIICKDANNAPYIFSAYKLVIGTGTKPFVPQQANDYMAGNLFHSSEYLFHKKEVEQAGTVTVVGSGQSAAEIFYDLLCHHPSKSLNWITQSDRLYAMEDHKMVFEMTSPDYINYFYGLGQTQKDHVLSHQHNLYKGVNHNLLNNIYDKLYELHFELELATPFIQTSTALKKIQKAGSQSFCLHLHHHRQNITHVLRSDCVILATGYSNEPQAFLKNIRHRIRWLPGNRYNVNPDYSIDDDHTIFVQNAEMHTHGFNAPDLGMGPYRNAVIINSILKKKQYPTDSNAVFQRFGFSKPVR